MDVGDKVTVHGHRGFGRGPVRVCTVASVGKVKTVLSDKSAWKTRDGGCWGSPDPRSSSYIAPWTQADSDNIKRYNLETSVSNFVGWKNMSEQELLAVKSQIDAYKARIAEPKS